MKENWRDKSPTEAQIKILTKYNKTAKTRGEASDMIAIIIETKNSFFDYSDDDNNIYYEY